MTTDIRRRPRTLLLVTVSILVALIVVTGLVWLMKFRSDPQPRFPEGSGVHTAENGPLPPGPVGDSDVRVQVNGVAAGSAEVSLYTPSDAAKTTATLAIGDTASLGDVTIRLCATWVNERLRPPWDDRDGSTDYADRIYYVFSVDGSAPDCPEQAK
ncbi:MAG: hypothetical protein HGA51_01580 [Demequinaceae bacterium]|nr:hypothetical protein [Demequinaceae bacterium]